MDVRRLVRMAVGGLVCVLIGALSFFVMWVLLTQVGGGEIRMAPWLGVLVLGALALEAFVLTSAGLILLVWAIVAGIAGPVVVVAPSAREQAHAGDGGRSPAPAPRSKEPVGPRVVAPVTATAMLDPDGGVSRLDPEKRRPPHA